MLCAELNLLIVINIITKSYQFSKIGFASITQFTIFYFFISCVNRTTKSKFSRKLSFLKKIPCRSKVKKMSVVS